MELVLSQSEIEARERERLAKEAAEKTELAAAWQEMFEARDAQVEKTQALAAKTAEELNSKTIELRDTKRELRQMTAAYNSVVQSRASSTAPTPGGSHALLYMQATQRTMGQHTREDSDRTRGSKLTPHGQADSTCNAESS